MNLNLVQVCGRITRDPEMITTPNGTTIAKFSVASNRVWNDKNSGQKHEEVEFHNIVSFGKQAETISQYFNKGDEIYIQGRLKTSSWEDKQSGQKRYKTEIIADKFEFGQKSKANQNASNQNADPNPSDAPANQNTADHNTANQNTANQNQEEEIKIEDIPF